MRKTLLIAAATLAVGVISSQASVYSANIVGYVNQTITGNYAYNFISAPVGAPGTVETLMPSINPGDGCYFWTGSGYSFYTYVGTPNWNGGTSGYVWSDSTGNEAASPVLMPNQLFIYVTGFDTFTNTFAGTVVLSNTVSLTGNYAYNFVSSAAPVTDTFDGTNLNFPWQPGDGAYQWTGGGYSFYTYVGTPNWNGGTSGYIWSDAGGNECPSPVCNVGSGFLYVTGYGDSTWTQNFVVPSN